jgi:hypothetical protein
MKNGFKTPLLQQIEALIKSEGGEVKNKSRRNTEKLESQYTAYSPEEDPLSCFHIENGTRHQISGITEMTLIVDSDDTIVLKNNADNGLIYSSLIATINDFKRVMASHNAKVRKKQE